MQSSINKFPLILLAGFFLFFLCSCAEKQWKEPLQENEAKAARSLVTLQQQLRDKCTCCIDAEISLTWDAQLSDGGLNGYLQVLSPSSIKLVAINPLGQPIYAVTSDGKKFQAINAAKGVYKYGRVSTFVDRYGLPENIIHKDWASWLKGELKLEDEQEFQFFTDAEGRGIWVQMEKTNHRAFLREFILIAGNGGKLLERVVFDKSGNEAARVKYNDWASVNGCPVPSHIEIQGVSYGTDIDIILHDIQNHKVFDATNFSLKLPPNFLQQYYP